MLKIKEKVAICYVCCGPTYRKTALDKLTNLYPENDNIYYFVLTDDGEYFSKLKKKNLVVNELKDFYYEFPELEIYEPYLESESVKDYADKFLQLEYKFPFSTNRFHFLQAKEFGISNIIMLGTDTDINLKHVNYFLKPKNKLYNSITRWYEDINNQNMSHVVDILKEKYNLKVDNKVMVFDAAAKWFLFESVEKMNEFFNIWNDIMFTLYREDKIKYYKGWYAVNDEFILAPIYNALGITGPDNDEYVRLFNAQHNPAVERFWLYTK